MSTDTSTPGRPMTFGEKAVGLTFNPSGDSMVKEIKEVCARLIDLCNDARTDTTSPEVRRLYSVAITEVQGAQMWAVKAATWKDS